MRMRHVDREHLVDLHITLACVLPVEQSFRRHPLHRQPALKGTDVNIRHIIISVT